jgi:F0F1-type ATP synthase epsilon subunit
MSFKVHIITPEKALPELDADHVTIVAVDGQVGIRTDHAPLVALLKEDGWAVVKQFGKEQYRAFAVKGGVAQMLKNDLKILTPTVVDVHTLDTAQLAKQVDAAKDAEQKRWLGQQLAVAQQFPPPAGRV